MDTPADTPRDEEESPRDEPAKDNQEVVPLPPEEKDQGVVVEEETKPEPETKEKDEKEIEERNRTEAEEIADLITQVAEAEEDRTASEEKASVDEGLGPSGSEKSVTSSEISQVMMHVAQQFLSLSIIAHLFAKILLFTQILNLSWPTNMIYDFCNLKLISYEYQWLASCGYVFSLK